LNLEGETVDRTDLNSIQGAMVKTGINFKPQVQAIASKHDRALWTAIFEGANSTIDIYAHIIYNSDQSALGRAMVTNYNVDGNTKEVQRPQFTLDFQGEDYAVTKPWEYETPARQIVINEMMKLSGLNPYS
jgi:hypothetical protein